MSNPSARESSTHASYSRNLIGVLLNSSVTITAGTQDLYGRQNNSTQINISYPGTPFYLTPYPPAAFGSLIYPKNSSFEQSQYARNFTSKVNYENYTQGTTPIKGTYNEEFLGHISISAGEITFFGNVTASLTWGRGDQGLANATEKTSYLLNGKPYAQTSAKSSYVSTLINGVYLLSNETVETETFFADGSHRTSQITILYQRDDHGTQTGKSGVGTVWGTDVIGERSVDYTGSIALSYINPYGVYIKSGYYETRNATSELLTRVPFEVLFIDDSGMRIELYNIEE